MRWRSLVGAASVVAALSLTGCSEGGDVAVHDGFGYPDGLVTNEYAHWNPSDDRAARNSTWFLTSGSLYADRGTGWSGRPDYNPGDSTRTSEPKNHSAVFRLTSHRTDIGDAEVTTRLRLDRHVSTPDSPQRATDGVHLWLRHQDERSLYLVSVARRDGQAVLKKKVRGGPSNGGTYHTLATARTPMRTGRWHDVRAVAENVSGGVRIELWVDDVLVVRATDRGTGGPPITAPGRIGIRADNTEFHVDDLEARRL